MDGYRQQAELYKALAHPVRLRILDILSREEACVCHLTAALNHRQPYVSQQLAMLRAAGLVADRRDGTLIYYRLQGERVLDLLADGRKATHTEGEGVQVALSPSPEDVVPGCTCPTCQGK